MRKSPDDNAAQKGLCAMRRMGAGLTAELREAPEAVRHQASEIAGPLADLMTRLARRPPDLVVTCARGSSAHAATFAKHLVERYLGIPVAEAAPNIASVYRRELRLKGQLFLAISQSGASDDLVETAAMARTAGALTAALVNDTRSPLARACEIVLPMAAGAEHSVAATKSFICSLAALLRVVAQWRASADLCGGSDRLPERLAAAAALDWSVALRPLVGAGSVVTIGRGPTLAIAREAALKLKETCGLPAEAFSSAEFRHGPIALVSSAYPVMVFAPTDESGAGLRELVTNLGHKGACVLLAEPQGARRELSRSVPLPAVAAEQAEADAICMIQSFYSLLVGLAERRGTDIDAPPHLQKVTRTR
jgi:glucosamine--fructose-6-phosphate aminotransferase (isomerizing)